MVPNLILVEPIRQFRFNRDLEALLHDHRIQPDLRSILLQIERQPGLKSHLKFDAQTSSPFILSIIRMNCESLYLTDIYFICTSTSPLLSIPCSGQEHVKAALMMNNFNDKTEKST